MVDAGKALHHIAVPPGVVCAAVQGTMRPLASAVGIRVENEGASDRGMEDFPDAGPSRYRNAKPGKVLENLDMVEKCRAQSFGGAGVVGADVIEKDLQVD